MNNPLAGFLLYTTAYPIDHSMQVAGSTAVHVIDLRHFLDTKGDGY